MSQAAKPAALIAWECGRPKLCWDCNYFHRETNHCHKHAATPPAEFQEAPSACPDWREHDPYDVQPREVPF
jgi:hypothetical protein